MLTGRVQSDPRQGAGVHGRVPQSVSHGGRGAGPAQPTHRRGENQHQGNQGHLPPTTRSATLRAETSKELYQCVVTYNGGGSWNVYSFIQFPFYFENFVTPKPFKLFFKLLKGVSIDHYSTLIC